MREVGVHPDWFVNINAGAHNFDRDLWVQRVANLREVAREVGVGLITIDTNFHEVFNVAHIRSHSVRLLAPAYSLFPGVARFVYSSTGGFEDISYAMAKKYDISYIDHAVCSTLTPAAISISILGSEADRIAKTAAIGEDPVATLIFRCLRRWKISKRANGCRAHQLRSLLQVRKNNAHA